MKNNANAFFLSSMALTYLLLDLFPIEAWVVTPSLCEHAAPGKILRLSRQTAFPATTTTTTTLTAAIPLETDSSPTASLTRDLITKLRFRELRRELESQGLDNSGTTSQLRNRLRQALGVDEECVVNEDGIDDVCQPLENSLDDSIAVRFVDQSNPDFDRTELLREIRNKAAKGHWKAATRKLKRYTRHYPNAAPVPESVYVETLQACMANRMQGARASEPARKIMDQMIELGYAIPESTGNYCIKNSLGANADATHQGFGGVDTALAMLAALEQSGTVIQNDTYEKIVESLAREGSIHDAMTFLRRLVIDLVATPLLSTFVTVASAAIAPSKSDTAGHEEEVITLLSYVKAAGYELDKLASMVEGRCLLASGIIAAERLNNEALGLRLLTAASKVENVELPGRGDFLVASSSAAAQRACMLIHKRAIIKAVESSNWKLAVKVLELMLERSLRPSNWIWRNVVTCCAKAEKSKKATALLMDWISLYREEKADQPPLSVFNTVVNACEICDEQQLTLSILDEMKKMHETDGNLITFNIALKRLAKQGNYRACEGFIIGMLQANVEPSVVSYTTAIASCVSGTEKQPDLAYEWIKRMRSRRVPPNVLTYNTAMSACLDGKLESTVLASKMATEMIADVNRQLEAEALDSSETSDEYTDVIPNAPTRMIARDLEQQLNKYCEDSLIDMKVANETVRLPLLYLIDFDKSEAAAKALAMADLRSKAKVDEDQALATSKDEHELEYLAVASSHRIREV